MANHGSVGNKFVSANLNKSYGQPSHFHHPSYSGSSYGQAAAGRGGRPSHAGGSGGMVVLSRPRSSQKSVPKLSVPPPLNLPSMRKEHEKFDLSGSGGGTAGGAGSGNGSRPNSSSMGWTKPGIATPQVKDGTGDSQVVDGMDQSVATDGGSRGSSTYVQPLARVGGVGHPVTGSAQAYPPRVEKAMVLRGEDFPSLQAALPLPATSGSVQKQKDSSQKKHQQVVPEESSLSNEQSDSYHLSSPVHMRPQAQSSHPGIANESKENAFNRFGGSRMADQPRKPEYFPGPLPLVRLNPRSDWADDERDTGHGIADRGREQGLPKPEAYWDREFEMPRSSLLPHKPPNNLFERPGQRREEIGKGFSSEVLKGDADHRDLRTPSREGREGKTWRPSTLQKDVQQFVNDRNDLGRSTGLNRDTVMENKYTPPPFGGDNTRDGVVKGNRDSAFARTNMGHGQHWNNTTGSFSSRGGERNTRDRYGAEQSSRHGVDSFHKFNVSKSSFSSGGKGFPISDPILNFSREKRVYSKSERPYVEDPFLKDFGSTGYDGSDPFSAGLVGVIKRKKDVVKPNDFHDPVRESFEAELERVQKMQEMERQRMIDEQERALEQARREEEERQRLIREEEERQRRMEEEAREAAWRAEQERLEAIRKAEEQKIAREEERRRIFVEEERRKEAAKQKLLELEARIARRQAETAKIDNSTAAVSDETVLASVKEKYISREADLDSWEDGERMVERITTSASSDSPVSNRPFDMNPRPHPSREGSSGFVDGGKFVNSWRGDVFENGNSSSFPRKDFYGGGYMSSRAYFKGGVQEPHVDEFAHLKEHGWSPYGDGDPYSKNREIESEFYENVGDRYGIGWGQGQRWYPNSDADDFYSYGRPRFSMRQPRVLPPPSLPPIHKASSIGDNERPGPSDSQGSEIHYNSTARSESNLQRNEPRLEKDSTPRCDSQSSLSVSSPPTSPTQLSHDELEESRNSPVKPTASEGKETNLYNESTILNENAGQDATLSAQSSLTGGEDEEWTLENNEELQEQEEYDEDEDGYQEEDEVHEVYDENLDMTREFEELEGKDSSHMNNLVLGFDEGVEVGIPGDELERDSRSEEVKFGIPEVSGSILEERRSVDDIQGDGQSIHHVDGSKRICETEKVIQDSITQTIIAPEPSTTPDLLDNIVSSSVETALNSSCGQAIMSVSSIQNQSDLPLKLQFGLFSGPSLIPSPVPAIQIGSIQMPLHLHPPVGPSIGHTHPSQGPLFQFGQLRYTSPVPQGVLPMAPQSMSFVQPNIQNRYNLNQNSGASLPIQPNQDIPAHNVAKSDENGARRLNSFTVGGSVENNALIPKGRTQISNVSEDKGKNESGVENYDLSSQSGEKDFNVSKNQGSSYGNKGKKISYSVKNSGFRSSFRASDDPRADSSGFQRRPQRAIQRTEFRVRESTNKNQSSGNNSELDGKSNRNGKGVGIYTGSGFKRGTVPNKPLKQIVESESSSSGPIISQEVDSDSRAGKGIAKESLTRSQGMNISQEDVDAPLQSGIVRVYEQPGIEAPSDEDDFIEVRSKRQMLNDRREQREKEIKAKSRVTKPPRKSRSSTSSTGVSNNSNKISASLVGEASNNNMNSNFLASEGQGLMNKDGSTCFSTLVSQPLAPIGTPSMNADAQTNTRSHSIKSIEAGSASAISVGAQDLGPTLIFETKNNVLDNVQTSLGSWGNAQINQQVMALTQTQLEEAMKPARFDSHVASIGNQISVSEPLLPSPSILSKDKPVSSSSSPINSLLAGEKIQFGAVTSPTLLPPSSRVISHVIGAPAAFRSDIQISHNLSQAENDCTLFFGKDKHPSVSHLVDCEAEAEAAASAVAAAAISSDEIVANGLGSVSVPDNTKSFIDTDVDAITGGVAGGQQSGNQSRAEESLSVSLPADLSVETQPISLWPALPSPQNSSNQMLSHFPGAPSPSHFPFYDMNSMLGGPIFTFGPHEESSGTQSQSQKSAMSAGSGHIGNWQQVHSPVDSFYGPPAGFAGPFISPPGGIPGVQPPPHMVVYNHYAPVGQFGQVGLSFMGTTYIPSGKQPDWKHNPTSSSMGMGEGAMNNMNMVSAQRNPPNMPSSIQHHLAPRSPILPMASPMALFDVSPFQSVPDMSVQPRWSHVPPPSLHSVPLSLPMQQQQQNEGVVLPSQFSHGHHVDQSLAPPPQSSTPLDKPATCPVVTKSQFPNERGLVDSSSSTVTVMSTQRGQSSSGSTTGKTNDTVQSGNSNTSSGQSTNNNNAFKNQQKNISGHQYNNHSTGYGYQRGGVSQKSGSLGECAHRRMGFHGRNQSLGAEKNFSNSKMKQVYVAKQTRSGPSTVG